MGDHFERISSENFLVQAIHTAVKGRARYKVSGLYCLKAFERYLEFQLSKEEIIVQARANHFTGNILVIFHPDFSPNTIALLLQGIVLDYKKETRKLPVSTDDVGAVLEKANYLSTEPRKQLNQAGSQLTLALSVVCALVLSTGLLRTYSLDQGILLAIQKLHVPLLDRLMLSITSLGDPVVLLLICLGLGIGPLYNSRRSEATTLGIAAVGAIGLNCWLKALFGRARPALWDRLINVGLHSFPSGHAMASIAVYGFLAYILAKQFPQWRGRIFTLTVVLIVAIGFSRLYLGVHWPTDVVAGYAIGLAWLIFCLLSLELYPKHTPDAIIAKREVQALVNLSPIAG